jgi:phosphatidate cytidylyltransferase
VTRVLSAIVLIAIVGSVIWFAPSWATAALATAAAAAAATVLAGLSGKSGAPVSDVFLAVSAAVVCLAFSGIGVGPVGGILLSEIALVAAVIGSCAVTLSSGAPDASTLARASTLFMGPMYIGVPLGLLARVHVIGGPSAITWFLVVMAASDTAQYYTGRAFGRRKLAPAVSPAKTVEGAIGGVLVTGVVGAGLAAPLIGASLTSGAVVAVLLAGLGMIGDLFESLLKRGAGVQASSSLIPGHGGVLDRIDSYLLAAPFYYLFVRYAA